MNDGGRGGKRRKNKKKKVTIKEGTEDGDN